MKKALGNSILLFLRVGRGPNKQKLPFCLILANEASKLVKSSRSEASKLTESVINPSTSVNLERIFSNLVLANLSFEILYRLLTEFDLEGGL